MREQARDDQHRRRLGDAKKFHRLLKQVAAGRCFDELVDKAVLEIVWGTPTDAVARENIHMDRLNSIAGGFNSCHAGWTGVSESNIGKPGRPRTEEHKAKLRGPKTEEHKAKLRKPKTEEHKAKLRGPRPAARGKPSPMKGIPRTEEVKAKLRGKPRPDLAALNRARKGIPISAEIVAARAAAYKQACFRRRESQNKTILFHYA